MLNAPLTHIATERGINLKEEFEAEIEENNYMGTYGWIEDVFIDPSGNDLLEDLLKKFIGKKVKITIEEIK